ncbi:MAG: insulinase family protein [Ignavibacteria bacterium]|jgi:predicted Zn-dependent peptidase|nr:insulinase family protein [Ignavibacteria bacterium]
MIEYKEYEYGNGLRLVMSRRPEIPNVIINSSFHAGSKDENPRKTGISHLLEHLMFTGSKNVPQGKFDEILHDNGGESNAYTSNDITSYYLSVPSSKTELGMWLDSDRLAEFPVNEESLEIQKKVVIEEKQQVHDNSPYGSFDIESAKRIFHNSGYRWAIIGDEDHIKSFTLEDVRDYFSAYYNPSNMVLSVTGDIDYDEIVNLTEKYYGSIPAGKKKGNYIYNEPEILKNTEEDIEDSITLPARFVLYRVPKTGTREFYALKLASVALTSGESSKIYRNLIESNISAEAYMYLNGMEFVSLFGFTSFINEGKTIKETAEVMDGITDELLGGGLSDSEIIKAKNKIQTSYYIKIQSMIRLANSFGFNKIFYNDCGMINREVRNFENLDNSFITETARKYLQKDKSIVLNYVPRKRSDY